MLRAGETFDPSKFITGDKSVSQVAGAEKATYGDAKARKVEESRLRQIVTNAANKRRDAAADAVLAKQQAKEDSARAAASAAIQPESKAFANMVMANRAGGAQFGAAEYAKRQPVLDTALSGNFAANAQLSSAERDFNRARAATAGAEARAAMAAKPAATTQVAAKPK